MPQWRLTSLHCDASICFHFKLDAGKYILDESLYRPSAFAPFALDENFELETEFIHVFTFFDVIDEVFKLLCLSAFRAFEVVGLNRYLIPQHHRRARATYATAAHVSSCFPTMRLAMHALQLYA
ncbi:MAG: hypothetical protein WBW33_15345 [Bryobacteraceae bacterium]